MSRTVADLLRDHTAALVGRDAELAVLRRALEPGGPIVVHVYGIAGIGKSTLIDAFADEARASGAAVLELDSRHIEPTERGFLAALSEALGGDIQSVADVAARLDALGDRVVIVLDTYEVLRILDAWVRGTLLPALPHTTRVVIAGREPPMSGWPARFGELYASVPLGNLRPDAALEILRRAGTDPAAAVRINRVARGHPLSLTLAAAATTGSVGVAADVIGTRAIVEELTDVYLRALDGLTREILDAASVVRRPTRSLLAVMLPHVAPQDAFERLRALPFVEFTPEGLALHDTVREAISASLRAADPERSRRYRAAAWRQLRVEVRRASPTELWRYTADLLYLIENAIIREAFFPSGEHHFAVEPASEEDRAEIDAVARRYVTPAVAQILDSWWRALPDSFRVVRDRLGTVVGFYVLAPLDTVSRRVADADPVTRRWIDHLRRDPIPPTQRNLGFRFALTRDHGEALCPELGVMWLDVKRVYMEMRPALRRLYGVVTDIEAVGPTLAPFGFAPMPGAPLEIEGVPHHFPILDFGPASVDGWLARLIGAELMVDDEAFLDHVQRQAVVDGQRVQLTRLEFDLLSYLHERGGTVVPRAEMLANVWGHAAPDAGSNVIEAVVRSLRRKLGDSATMIETVRGTGYRLNDTR